MTVHPSICPAALQWSTSWQPRCRTLAAAQQQVREQQLYLSNKLSSQLEQKLGCRVLCFFSTFQAFLCTSRRESSPSLSCPISRLIASLGCSLGRVYDQRPTERKKEEKENKGGIDSILNDVSDYWGGKKILQGAESRPIQRNKRRQIKNLLLNTENLEHSEELKT